MPPLKGLKGNVSLIIIKKKRHILTGGGHGGSAWKIAYADFVTAMMAFFLLMWLVNSMSHEADKGTFEFFDPLSVSDASSGSGGVLGGQTITSDGAMPDVTATPAEEKRPIEDQGGIPELDMMNPVEEKPKMTAEQERKEFEEAKEKIEEYLESSPEMKEVAKNLLMEITSEGLKIQIVDQFKRPMFPSGSSMLYYDAQQLLNVVAKTIKDLPQQITITGHTDNRQYTRGGYSNWDLSTDRANAVRRYLMKMLAADRILEIAGKADTDPLLVNDPLAPSNRRVSILLKSIASSSQEEAPKKKGKEATLFRKEDVQPVFPVDKPRESKIPVKTPQTSQ